MFVKSKQALEIPLSAISKLETFWEYFGFGKGGISISMIKTNPGHPSYANNYYKKVI